VVKEAKNPPKRICMDLYELYVIWVGISYECKLLTYQYGQLREAKISQGGSGAGEGGATKENGISRIIIRSQIIIVAPAWVTTLGMKSSTRLGHLD
jgi:hypothetical protein